MGWVQRLTDGRPTCGKRLPINPKKFQKKRIKTEYVQYKKSTEYLKSQLGLSLFPSAPKWETNQFPPQGLIFPHSGQSPYNKIRRIKINK